jgi:hypothetical protein
LCRARLAGRPTSQPATDQGNGRSDLYLLGQSLLYQLGADPREAGMGTFWVFVIVGTALLVIKKMGDWFDSKTGWILGAIVTGGAAILLTAAAIQATKPKPLSVCVQEQLNFGHCLSGP